ncbi:MULTISPECIES: hypothetical protein [unclassified Erythrobacter]|jgi:hypothetical protein|uniref:hypothetical protein n=1 Tax=unclassified Erythrobacter TaxID=2633097 RepID=UPI0007BA664D|nr:MULTISPECIES: hypothetical protein [unclassified Erythrobacter]KZY90554.1 hypothetical protein A3745_06600 [Erythrobacter sp. HI0074]KZZ05315.1 hypothetical protein A3748_05580 [Erythrobacter sp. HI0077]
MSQIAPSESLEVRSVEAAEASVLQSERAVDAAYLSMGLSLLAFLALLVTIFQGRRALANAEAANALSSESTEKQLRAYLSVEPAGVQDFAKGWIAVPIKIFNHGMTPAADIEVAGDVLVLQGDPREFDPQKLGRLEDQSLSSETMIGPNANRFHLAKLTDEFVADHWEKIRDMEAAIVHYGWIGYTDVFGKKRRTNFAFYHWGNELSDVESKRCRFGNSAT